MGDTIPIKTNEPVPRTPSTVAELDRLKWALLLERLARFEAQVQTLQREAQHILADTQRAREAVNNHARIMRETYGLSDLDAVDLETGEIDRKGGP